jgi:hypothetical protein
MASIEEVQRTLSFPPKNMVGKEGQKIALLTSTWISDCAGKCTVAELTQEETNAVFWAWLKRGKYTEMVQNYMIKKLIRAKRPKVVREVNQEARARKVLVDASKLQGLRAVYVGEQIVEKGKEAGDTLDTLATVWLTANQKPRKVIDEMMEDIERQLLIAHNDCNGNDPPLKEAAE